LEPRFEPLAAYNAEVARGIAHTPAWDERMAYLQAEYDDMMAMAATYAAGETLNRMSAEAGMAPRPDGFVITRARPNCLPGCDRLDEHDGHDPEACMRDGEVLTQGRNRVPRP
jgi:hypothetical protein